MKATIYMEFEGDENHYPYGTFDFDTDTEKSFVNELAIKISRQRGCETYVVERV